MYVRYKKQNYIYSVSYKYSRNTKLRKIFLYVYSKIVERKFSLSHRININITNLFSYRGVLIEIN